MKTFEEDKKLGQLLRSARPESPGRGFSSRVMDRIFEEQYGLEQVKQQPVLGRGFWIILALFAVLLGIFVLLSGGGQEVNSSPALFPDVNTDAVMTGYRSFFEKLGGLPASVAGILMASSLLIFLERFLGSRSHVLI